MTMIDIGQFPRINSEPQEFKLNCKNKNPIEIERINTPGIVWHCGWTTSD